MNERKQHLEKCPLCEEKYTKRNPRTRHHLFPKHWYGPQGIKVVACAKCHCQEFHHSYQMTHKWNKQTCVKNWMKFCLSKGKDPLILYPQLSKLFT